MSKPPPPPSNEEYDDASIPQSSEEKDAPSSSVARAHIQPEEPCPQFLRFIYDCPMICKVPETKKLKKAANKF